MRPEKYILVGDNPRPCRDLLEWAHWFERGENRTVACDETGESTVSTVFLGLDHNFSEKGPPILWETMVFKGPLAGSMSRCAGSKEQALAMHAAMVKRVKES